MSQEGCWAASLCLALLLGHLDCWYWSEQCSQSSQLTQLLYPSWMNPLCLLLWVIAPGHSCNVEIKQSSCSGCSRILEFPYKCRRFSSRGQCICSSWNKIIQMIQSLDVIRPILPMMKSVKCIQHKEVHIKKCCCWCFIVFVLFVMYRAHNLLWFDLRSGQTLWMKW